VILSASVCNQEGKVLVARQFVSMSRLRIEGLLSAFPKLLNSDQGETQKKQHTYVETDEVRYLYQPIDTMYVLIVTNVRSNILQDLQTLRLLAKLVPEYCQGYDEEFIVENAFDLIFAFDEAVSLGHSEDVTMDKIKTFMEMDSHEEKLANIIKETQLENAKQKAKERAKELEDMRRSGGTPTTGYSGGMGGGTGFNESSMSGGMSGIGSSSGGFGSSQPLGLGGHSDDDEDNVRTVGRSKSKKKGKKEKKGMSLGMPGKRSNVNSDLAAMMEEEKDVFGSSMGKLGSSSAATESDDYSSTEPVKIKIQEKCTIDCDRDGTMKKFQVDGAVNLTVMNPDFARINISVEKDGMDGTFRTHPKVDKKAWKNGNISWKDKESGFPVGSSNKQSVLKWKIRSKEEEPPVKVNFWPSEENGVTVIACSYEVEGLPDDMTLNNVVLTIPGIENKPDVTSIDGEHSYDRGGQEFQWAIGDVENGSSGELEMSLDEEAEDDDQFYPISVNFNSENLFSGLRVQAVSTFEDDAVEFVCQMECFASKFEIN